MAQIVADLPDSPVTQHSQPQSLQARLSAASVPAGSLGVFRDGQLARARASGHRQCQPVAGGWHSYPSLPPPAMDHAV